MSSTAGTHTVGKPAAKVKLQLPELEFEFYHENPDCALGRKRELTARGLATALSKRCSLKSIKDYLQRFPKEEAGKVVQHMVKGHRVLTYAVDTDNVEVVQLLLEYNVDVNIFAHESGNVPLLAFSIMRAEKTGISNHEVVRMLLAHGADPMAIPRSMWQDYRKTPHSFVTDKEAGTSTETWCTPHHRGVLTKTLDMTTRYLLWLASRLSPPKKRFLQIAVAYKTTRLINLPLQIIGQEPTARMIMENVLAHVGFNTTQPLVMAFAGPSGHGKTELATQMGAMLSVPMIKLDCTHMGNSFSLFGSTLGYHGNAEGAPLNNFLAEHEGKRCVVFLDEFEKTNEAIHESLLKVMDDGLYRDRRPGRSYDEVDCRKVIWILATNLGDREICSFYASNLEGRKDDDAEKVSLEPLQNRLSQVFSLRFSPAVAGRINIISPFFPFSPGEQVAVAHKFLTTLKQDLRRPINMEEPHPLYVGHVDLHVVDDDRICEYLAKRYEREEGARSIRKAVLDVRRKVFIAYSQTDKLVTEDINEEPLTPFTLQVSPISENEEELSVFSGGIANH